jgi:hypothetical protein
LAHECNVALSGEEFEMLMEVGADEGGKIAKENFIKMLRKTKFWKT